MGGTAVFLGIVAILAAVGAVGYAVLSPYLFPPAPHVNPSPPAFIRGPTPTPKPGSPSGCNSTMIRSGRCP